MTMDLLVTGDFRLLPFINVPSRCPGRYNRVIVEPRNQDLAVIDGSGPHYTKVQ